MANPDLRDWLAQMEAAGERQKVSGADRKEEIGGIVDIYQRETNRPALLFDEIPGYPRGYRVAANILTGVKRIALTLGMPAESNEIDLVNYWRKYLTEAKVIPPVTVKTGPVLENVTSGKEVNLAKIPVHKWHEDDGGPYIGTGCMVIMKDRDSGWINYGAYRIQTQGPDVATVMMSPGKHGRILMGKYHERGQPCPVAVPPPSPTNTGRSGNDTSSFMSSVCGTAATSKLPPCAVAFFAPWVTVSGGTA